METRGETCRLKRQAQSCTSRATGKGSSVSFSATRRPPSRRTACQARRGYPMTEPRFGMPALRELPGRGAPGASARGSRPCAAPRCHGQHSPDNPWSSCPTDNLACSQQAPRKTRRAHGPRTRRTGRSEHGSAISAIPLEEQILGDRIVQGQRTGLTECDRPWNSWTTALPPFCMADAYLAPTLTAMQIWVTGVASGAGVVLVRSLRLRAGNGRGR
jgi:hypothetical protein